MRPARLLLPLLALVSARAAPPPVDVYLLGGQSNMQGLGKLAEADKTAVPGVRFWNGKAFEPLDLRTTRVSARDGEFGPEVGFVRGLRAAGVAGELCLVKFHRSGQGLDAGWNDQKWLGDPPGPGRATFHAGTGPDDPNIGRHYRDWLAQARAALADLRSEGREPAVRAVLWVQGECDAKQPLSAARWPDNLRRLRLRLAADLGIAPPPWVYAQVLPAAAGVDRFAARDALRAGMAALDAESRRGPGAPEFRMVPTDGFGVLPDRVHFDTDGQLRLGEAMAGRVPR